MSSSAPQRLRPRPTQLLAIQYDGSRSSAAAIGRWLGRDVTIVHGILFTRTSGGDHDHALVPHGGAGCWVVQHPDGSISTEWNEWITKHFEADAGARHRAAGLVDSIVTAWSAQHKDQTPAPAFHIADARELLDYLTSAVEDQDYRDIP